VEKRKIIKQSSALYLSGLLGLGLGFVVSIINTSLLTSDAFGAFKFVQQLFAFFSVFMSLGVAYSTSRLLAISKCKQQERELVGGTIITYCGLSVIGMILLIVISMLPFIENIKGLNSLLLIATPFVAVSIFNPVINNVLQGLNRIDILVFFKVAPQVLYIIVIIFYDHFYDINVSSLLMVSYGTACLIVIYCLGKLSPTIPKVRGFISSISVENRKNGFPVYLGSLVAVGAANLLGVFLGLYVDLKTVGFYTLAVMIASSLQMIPSVIATVSFKEFSLAKEIPVKMLFSSAGISVCSLIIFQLLIENVVLFVYSEEYRAVISFSRLLCVAAIFHGFGDIFNRFLGAKGLGKNIRNGAFIAGGTIIFGAVPILTAYGGYGAPILRLSSSLVYFSSMMFYYINYIRMENEKLDV
jgi:O-antigen/teichoic acid export membrane protein